MSTAPRRGRPTRSTPRRGAGAPTAARPGVGGRGGARLASAFDAVEAFPVLAEARRRLVRAANAAGAAPRTLSPSDRVRRRRSTVVVLRAANTAARPPRADRQRPRGGRARSAPAASSTPPPHARGLRLPRIEGAWGPVPERMRRHAVATRAAAERIAEMANLPARDDLAAAALLHDFGRLVLLCLYGEYPKLIADPELSAEERLRVERRELGIDHALVGGVLARRLGVPAEIASAIERHHAADADGRRRRGRRSPTWSPTTPTATRSRAEARERRAKALGLKPAELRSLLYEFPYAPARAASAHRAVPALGTRARRAARPRRGQGLQGDRRGDGASRRAPCAPTCTTSTARSARPTAPRRCWSPATAAGSKPR